MKKNVVRKYKKPVIKAKKINQKIYMDSVNLYPVDFLLANHCTGCTT